MPLTSHAWLDLAMELATDHLYPARGCHRTVPSGKRGHRTFRYLVGDRPNGEGMTLVATESATTAKLARTKLAVRLLARLLASAPGVKGAHVEFEAGPPIHEPPPPPASDDWQRRARALYQANAQSAMSQAGLLHEFLDHHGLGPAYLAYLQEYARTEGWEAPDGD